MGADSVVAWYGVRYRLGSALSDEEIEPLEARSDPRIVAARRVGLQSRWGRTTDGGEYFLLVGTLLGVMGIENEAELDVPDDDLDQIRERTRRLLGKSGLDGQLGLHFQLEAQF